MAQVKKVLITLPESLLSEVDSLASMDKKNRSEFIREAMNHYLRERKRLEIREQMIRGYQEMAGLNSELAESHLAAENEALETMENRFRIKE